MALFTTLIVGLGGTGSKIAERVLQRAVENQSAMQARIGILAMDTDVGELKDLRLVEPRSRLAFASPGNINTLLERNQDAERTWCIDRSTMSKAVLATTVIRGAKQFRMLTRLALHDSFSQAALMGKLEDAIARLAQHSQDQTYDEHVDILIAGSLAGATGSGSFCQVALALRAAARARNIGVTIRGVFLLPDVYARSGTIPESQIPNVLANGYAALKELNALTLRGLLPERATGFEFEYVPGRRLQTNLIPFDSITFIDYENVRGGNMGASEQSYLDMAARAGFQLAFSPLGGRFAAVAVNNILQTISELNLGGINLYSGIGIASVSYPAESMRLSLSRRLVLENLKGDWTRLDRAFADRLKRFRDDEAAGVSTAERPDIRVTYVRDLEQLARQEPRLPFFRRAWDFLVPRIRDERTKTETEVPRSRSFVDAVLAHVRAEFWRDARLDKINHPGAMDLSSLMETDSIRQTVREAEFHLNSDDGALHEALEKRPVDIYMNDLLSSDGLRADEAQPHHLQSVILKGSPHPVAVRAFLYMAVRDVEDRLRALDVAEARLTVNRLANRFLNPGEDQSARAKPTTREVIQVHERAGEAEDAGRIPNLLGGKRKRFALDYSEYYNQSYQRLRDWANKGIDQKVLTQLQGELNAAIRAFEGLFAEIGELSRSLEDDLAKSARTFDANAGFDGNSYVYADAACQDDAWRRAQQKAGGLSLDTAIIQALVGEVFRRYREDRRLHRDTNFSEIREVFETRVLHGFGADVVRNDLADVWNISVVEAMRRELEVTSANGGPVTPDRVSRHLKSVVDRVSRQAEPYVSLANPDGNGTTMKFWTLNKRIRGDLGNDALFLEMFKSSNGENPIEDNDFSAHDLTCVNFRVNLKLEDFSKLAPAAADLDNALAGVTGRYWAAYNQMIKASLAQEAADGRINITPHVDKTWHIPGVLPGIFPSEGGELAAKTAKAWVVATALGLLRLEREDDGTAVTRFNSRGRGIRDAINEALVPSHRPWAQWQAFKRRNAMIESALAVWKAEIAEEEGALESHPAYGRLTDPGTMMVLMRPAADRGDGHEERDAAVREGATAWLDCMADLIASQEPNLSEAGRRNRLRKLFLANREKVAELAETEQVSGNVRAAMEAVLDTVFDSQFSR